MQKSPLYSETKLQKIRQKTGNKKLKVMRNWATLLKCALLFYHMAPNCWVNVIVLTHNKLFMMRSTGQISGPEGFCAAFGIRSFFYRGPRLELQWKGCATQENVFLYRVSVFLKWQSLKGFTILLVIWIWHMWECVKRLPKRMQCRIANEVFCVLILFSNTDVKRAITHIRWEMSPFWEIRQEQLNGCCRRPRKLHN